jgi:hypothetical protein
MEMFEKEPFVRPLTGGPGGDVSAKGGLPRLTQTKEDL